jgi:hypothetical protein
MSSSIPRIRHPSKRMMAAIAVISTAMTIITMFRSSSFRPGFPVGHILTRFPFPFPASPSFLCCRSGWTLARVSFAT